MSRFGAGNCRDRTAEFEQIVKVLEASKAAPNGNDLSNGYANPGRSGPSRPLSASQKSEFSSKAANIGKGIQSASQRLLRLSQLAKAPPGPFDDNAQEIAGLSALVKQEIQQLNTEIADLQNLSQLGTDGNQQTGRHATTVVGNLRARLKDATKEFKDVLTQRQQNLKTHQERRSYYSAIPDRPIASTSGGNTFRDRGSLFPPNALKGPAQGEPGQAQSQTERTPLLGSSQQQTQALMVPQQDTYLNSRAEALHNVESTIHELGSIFQNLAQMVSEQGELAIRIDENVDDALANVDSAQQQLLKYLNSISSNRWLAMKVFFVLMFFTFIFITFIA